MDTPAGSPEPEQGGPRLGPSGGESGEKAHQCVSLTAGADVAGLSASTVGEGGPNVSPLSPVCWGPVQDQSLRRKPAPDAARRG